MNTIADDKILKAKCYLISDEVFFGYLVCHLNFREENNSVQTMATDGKTIFWNREFVEALSFPEVKTILIHEVLHVCLQHCFRRNNRDIKRWNKAADFALNLEIEDLNILAKKANQPIPFPWPTGDYAPLLDNKYRGMSAEEIYNLLPEDNNKNNKGGNGNSDKPSMGEVMDGPSKDENGQPQDIEKLAQEWKENCAAAAQLASKRGNLPASMQRLVAELIQPKRGWKELLREFITCRACDDYSFLRPNRKYISSGFILPSLHSNRMGPILIAVDTSGSISGKILESFVAEIENIVSECRPEKIIIFDVDAEVNNIREFDIYDNLPRQFKGGGGTDMRKIFTTIEKEQLDPCCVIVLTDMETPFPDTETIPTIWATTSNIMAPVGTTIRLD